MFERFTDRSRRVIILAEEESKISGNMYLEPDHIFIGILNEGEGVGAKMILKLGLDTKTILSDLRKKVATEQTSATSGTAPGRMTPNTKKVMDLALREALQLGNGYVGTEHLLLAIIKHGQSRASQMLTDHGITYTKAHKALADILEEYKEVVSPQAEDRMASAGTAPPKREKNSALIDQFGRNLTADAQANKLDPVIGRQKEIHRIMQILARRTKNNPVLVGPPGVGKTALVEGLAQSLLSAKAPRNLKEKIIYTLDLSLLVAGARFRGDFEERLKKLMAEVKARGNIILFIDEIHTIVGAGSAEGSLDASNILKPMLSRGEFQTIGATTIEEFRKYFSKDAALERRFQPINVDQPTVKETEAILRGLRDRYEGFHKVTITDEAIVAAVTLSDRYVQDRFLPDKAIDLIDEASARARLALQVFPPEIDVLSKEIEDVQALKENAIEAQEYEQAASFRDQEEKLVKKRNLLETKWRENEEQSTPSIGEEEIAELLSESTGVPVSKLTEKESKRLIRMEKELHKQVIGQDEAIKALSRTIRRQRTGLKDPNRPSGSFIFAGSTGVGKSQLAKAIAEFMFGDSKSLISLDMSEYSEKHTISRLIGSPPGYVGHEDGGQLTEAVRRKPFSVILLDEIEKAHPDVFNPLLQILDEGRLTDGQGRVVDFKNTIVIMTTNLGAREISAAPLGFSSGDASQSFDIMAQKVRSVIKQEFKPEFLNRLDDVIVFARLQPDELVKIVSIFIDNLTKRLVDTGIELTITNEAKEKLAVDGYSVELGARPLKRVIQRDIEDSISELLLLGKIEDNKISITLKDNEYLFNGYSKKDIEEFFEGEEGEE